jgi:hypothetical protein
MQHLSHQSRESTTVSYLHGWVQLVNGTRLNRKSPTPTSGKENCLKMWYPPPFGNLNINKL